MGDTALVTDEAVRLILAADDQWAARTGSADWKPLSEGRVRNLLEAAAPLITDAKLAEVRETVTTFLNHYGHSTAASFKVALDLAHGVLQVLDRKPLERTEEGAQ